MLYHWNYLLRLCKPYELFLFRPFGRKISWTNFREKQVKFTPNYRVREGTFDAAMTLAITV